ncbi:hypothetical protein CMI42_06435 [Candidatus Pacearchaeota archaeon]|nr:hypothetical protein [Candidatus Pacearchaeota archaeon]|tara:strand:+ start:164 stop:1222 length:1059 start_codon:yes stop_codon:yes gene_type:complete
MGKKEGFKQLVNYVLILALFILAFLVIKPIIFAIIYGILLAYIFYPVYKILLSKIKSETLSSLLVTIGVLILFGIFSILLLRSLLTQAVNFYISLQQLDIPYILAQTLPEFVSKSEASSILTNSINNSLSNLIGKLASTFGNSLLNLPNILLQFLVVFIIFFFGLRDGKKAFEYFKSLSHLSKETQNKFFKHFDGITKSVLVGQILVGIVQGLVAGIGYFILGVPNALLLSILTMIIGVIPIIGPWLVWIPIDVYLFVSGRSTAGLILLVYGLLVINWIDAIIRPLIVSRRTEINPSIILIGMIGGLYFFNIIGLILGPLILSYVLLVLEVYRKNNLSSSIFQISEKRRKTT